MCSPRPSNRSCSERCPGQQGHGPPSLASLPVVPPSFFTRPVGCIQMYECGRRVLQVSRGGMLRGAPEMQRLARQRCWVPPGSVSLGTWTSFLHLWACTTRSQGQPRTFRHLAACRKGTLKGLNPVSCFYGKKQGVSFFFFFLSLQISHFSQLKENQFYFVMCLT